MLIYTGLYFPNLTEFENANGITRWNGGRCESMDYNGNVSIKIPFIFDCLTRAECPVRIDYYNIIQIVEITNKVVITKIV